MTALVAPAPRALLDAAQVGQKLGHDRVWFMGRKRRLIGEAGFPPPVPHCGLRWDERAIDAWLDGQMPEALRSAALARTAAPEDPVERDRQAAIAGVDASIELMGRGRAA